MRHEDKGSLNLLGINGIAVIVNSDGLGEKLEKPRYENILPE